MRETIENIVENITKTLNKIDPYDFVNTLKTLKKENKEKFLADYVFRSCMYFSESILDLTIYILEKEDLATVTGRATCEFTDKGKLYLREKKLFPSGIIGVFVCLSYFRSLIGIPDEIYTTIDLIRKTRNVLVHDSQEINMVNVELAKNLLVSYSHAISWMLTKYLPLDNDDNIKRKDKILRCLEFYLIDIDDIFNKKDYKFVFPMKNRICAIDEEEDKKIIDNLKDENEMLKRENIFLRKELEKYKSNDSLSHIAKQNERIFNMLESMGLDIKDVKQGVDEINQNMESVLRLLQENKDNIDSILSKASKFKDEEKVEEIISNFADRMTADFVIRLNKNNMNEQFAEEEKILINTFSEKYWNKLNDNSKEYLITGKALYNKLVMSDKGDYSGVCLLITKAVDNELHRYLYDKFRWYLEKKYPFDVLSNKWPTFFLKQNKCGEYYIINDYDFTLGSVAYFCCNKLLKNESDNEKNKYALMDFCKNVLMKENLSESDIKKNLAFISESAEKTRIDFRNPAAHISSMSKIKADECLSYIIETTKILIELMKIFR